MTTLTESNGIQIKERQPGTWGTAFLAGLLHLLMGLLIGIGKLGNMDNQVSQTGNAIVPTIIPGMDERTTFPQSFPSCPSSSIHRPMHANRPDQYHCQADPDHALYGHSLPPTAISNDLIPFFQFGQLSAS